MVRIEWIIAAALSAAVGVAVAKLPPPTDEQKAAATAKKDAEKANIEKEKALLEKAQDRVAEHYKRTKGGSATAQRGGRTEATNIPDPATRHAPGDAGPKGGTKQSAEAHSAPAK